MWLVPQHAGAAAKGLQVAGQLVSGGAGHAATVSDSAPVPKD